MKRQPVSITAYSDPAIIAALTAELERQRVAALDIETADGSIAIAIHPRGMAEGQRPATMPAPVEKAAVLAFAPTAGHFLPEHPLRPGSAPEPGTLLGKGQIAGFVKVGPVLVSVSSEADGVAGSRCAQPGALVGFGDPLIMASAER